jgi:hypothetical protein
LWKSNDIISYNDHGAEDWAGIHSTEIPLLSNSLVFNYACSTCASQNQTSFCGNAIKQGAVIHIGAVSIAYSGNTVFRDTFNNVYYYNMSIGEGFNKAYGASIKRFNTTYYLSAYKMFTLVGDPTLHYNPNLRNLLVSSW